MKSKKDKLNEEFARDIKPMIKKKKLNPSEIKKMAQQEHDELVERKEGVKEKSIAGKPSKRVHRTTIDFPRELWADVRKVAADEYMPIKSYILMLIKKDLAERRNNK